MHRLRGRDEKVPSVVCMHRMGGGQPPKVERGKVITEVKRGMWRMKGGETTDCRAAAVEE